VGSEEESSKDSSRTTPKGKDAHSSCNRTTREIAPIVPNKEGTNNTTPPMLQDSTTIKSSPWIWIELERLHIEEEDKDHSKDVLHKWETSPVTMH